MDVVPHNALANISVNTNRAETEALDARRYWQARDEAVSNHPHRDGLQCVGQGGCDRPACLCVKPLLPSCLLLNGDPSVWPPNPSVWPPNRASRTLSKPPKDFSRYKVLWPGGITYSLFVRTCCVLRTSYYSSASIFFIPLCLITVPLEGERHSRSDAIRLRNT
jgi:hypothetical protein